MGWSLSIATSESQNASANQSTISVTAYLNWDNGSSFANYDQEVYITIGDSNSGAIAIPRAVNYKSTSPYWNTLTGSVAIGSWSRTYTHDANGYRGAVGTSAWLDGDGGFGPPDLSAGGPTYGAIDYVRIPNTPSTPSFVSRNQNSIVMNTSASVPGNAPGITSYNWQVSTDASSWSGISGQTGSTLSWTGANATTQYYFRAQAVNSEGGSSWSSASAIVTGAPSQPIAPTLQRSGTNVTVGLSTPSSNGSTLTTFTLQYSTSSLFPTESTTSISNISSATYQISSLPPGNIYYFRYLVGSNRGDSVYSPIANITIPAIPAAPTITTALTKQVRKVTVDWDAPTLNGATISSYELEARYSSDGGSTWDTSFTQITTTTSSVTVYTTSDLNIAKTYQFRVRAITDVGNTQYSSTTTLTAFNSIFISAYGYRYDGANFNTAIQFAARYTGNSDDTISVLGTTYTGWKIIENVKRYDGNDFVSLTQ